VRDGERALRYTAPADGKYDFYLVLRNAAGVSAPPPEPGSTPAVTVFVDTTPPLFQVHSTATEPGDEGRPVVAMKATLVEENLSESAVRVFYRTAPGDWLDGGTAHLAGGRLAWSPPESAGPLVTSASSPPTGPAIAQPATCAKSKSTRPAPLRRSEPRRANPRQPRQQPK